jgi:hypothetical protein
MLKALDIVITQPLFLNHDKNYANLSAMFLVLFIYMKYLSKLAIILAFSILLGK